MPKVVQIMDEDDLLKIKSKIDTLKTRMSELSGAITELKKQMKKFYDVATVAQAKSKSKEIKKEIDDLDEKIENFITEIEEKYLPEDDE